MSEEIKSKYQRKQQQPSRTKHCKEQKEVLFISLDFFWKPKCINPTENSYFKTEFTYNFIRKHELSACYGMSVKIIHYSFLKKITRQSFLNFSYFFNQTSLCIFSIILQEVNMLLEVEFDDEPRDFQVFMFQNLIVSFSLPCVHE